MNHSESFSALVICKDVSDALLPAFSKAGVEKARIRTIWTTANRSYATAVKAAFAEMRNFATDTQRDLSRSLLPLIQQRMKAGYENTTHVAGGAGKFNRMKHAMETHSHGAVTSMFDDSMTQLLAAIQKMIKELCDKVKDLVETISKCLSDVYSILWDEQSQSSEKLDLEMQAKVRQCRDALLPLLNDVRKSQGEAMQLIGLEHEDPECEATQVLSGDAILDKAYREAEARGEVIDLCDSDEEDGKPAAVVIRPFQSLLLRKVKSEPGRFI